MEAMHSSSWAEVPQHRDPTIPHACAETDGSKRQLHYLHRQWRFVLDTWERTVCRLLRGLSSSGQVLDGAIPRVHVPRQILKIVRAADLGSDRLRMHEVAATRLAALRQHGPHHLQRALLETPQPLSS